jgi:S-DNA-T family DNA segregation ATPase FtsK/SpoIIIE
MATSVRSKKTAAPEPKEEDPILKAERKRQIRLGIGIFLLLSGGFICFSIISYYFNQSWTDDQDNFYSSKGLWNFLFVETRSVSNWGGRLGAAISHALVYKGAGVASIVIGFVVGAVGMKLVYREKSLGLIRYIRWTSIALLLLAPTLTYLYPGSSFPLGGMLGNMVIDYLSGFMGRPGTGLLLFGTIMFFIFVIFALDLRPVWGIMWNRLKKWIVAMTPEPAPEQKFNTEQPQPMQPEKNQKVSAMAAAVMDKEENEEAQALIPSPPPPGPGNRLKNTSKDVPFVIEDRTGGRPEDTPYEVDDEEVPDGALDLKIGGIDEDEFMDEDQDEKEWDEEEIDNIDVDRPEVELNFEVKHKPQRTTMLHGTHISIADNEPYAPELDLPDYKFPTLDLLENRPQEELALNKEELARNKDQIVRTLSSFGIEISQITATVGPTVTLYEIVPAQGIRISKIKNLEDDIALNLAALGIRIIAPIPGKGTIGIEVPNITKQIVSMQALLTSEEFMKNKMSLPIALGKRIDNKNYIVDLATMPHLLMAGATGQGKSVGINAILVSLLYKKHPSQLKFVMVDPKKVELSIYRVIEKHFLAKLPNEEESIITDIKKVIYTLKALCDEMDDRYGLLKDAGARNIKEYNEKFIARRLNPENGHKYLPFIVLVIDEFADLIMTAGKEVEMPIARLAQLARAVGIHLIIATQRPSVNVITGTIKANFPARIAFKVSAKVDSRTILDTGGAEQLVGRGDMLISHGSELLRLQCAFVDTPEVERIVEFIGRQRGYPTAHPLPEPEMDDEDSGAKSFDPKTRDKLFSDCGRVVVQTQSGSTSMLQRRFNLGYNRAGRIMDQLEAAGVVGPAVGSKPRDVYFKTESELDEFLQTLN